MPELPRRPAAAVDTPATNRHGDAVQSGVSFLWLEITGKCQLQCTHCYADSGPTGVHGPMTREDWTDVLSQAEELGVRTVQFIGGEPSLHPDLPRLVHAALERSLEVEVFTNLVRISPSLWKTIDTPGVRLATSYYSDDADQHDEITGRARSHARTHANIQEVQRRSIPLRVGIIDVHEGQRVEQARDELTALGVVDVHLDRLRQVGRGRRDRDQTDAELCGSCAQGVAAVSTNGDVWPCVLARWITLGNVRTSTLADIVRDPLMKRAAQHLGARRRLDAGCDPRCCPNNMCDPQCSPSCSPSCRPAGNCRPSGNCAPRY